MRNVRSALSILFLLCLLAGTAGLFPLHASALEDPVIEGDETVYLYNVDYDAELFHSAFAEEGSTSDKLIFPASTVKIMTGLIACEQLEGRLDDTITVTAAMLNNVVGNNMGLNVGEKVRIRDMIYGLLTNGANDAAQVLAVLVGGTVENFVSMMNTRAAELRMDRTNYTNPTGMHSEKMVTTLRDLAALAKAAMKNELLMTATSEVKYVMEATNKSAYRNLYNRNCMISTFYNTTTTDYRYTGVRGINAGYTVQGGYCLITTATRNNLTYLCIVLGGKETEKGGISSYETAISLLDWAFESYTRVEVLSSSMVVTEMKVDLSMTVDYVKLRVKMEEGQGAFYQFLPTDTDVSREITYSWNTYEESLQAPVVAGTEVGDITVLYQGEILCSAKLVTDNDVSRSDLLYFLSKIKNFTKSVFFWATLAAMGVLAVIYIIVQASREERAARRKHTAGTAVNLTISPSTRRGMKQGQNGQAGASQRHGMAPSGGRSASQGPIRSGTGSPAGRRSSVPPVNPSRRR